MLLKGSVIAFTGDVCRYHHVLYCREFRQQLVKLENEANVFVPKLA